MENQGVTVLLPVKNGGEYLLNSIRNIESFLSPMDEILVVDDNSTDGTPRILEKWAHSNSRVRVIANKGSGIVDALNLGLKEARFEWIARVDVDDDYSCNRLSTQKLLIQSDVVAIFSDYDLYYEGVRLLGTIRSAVFSPAVSVSLISAQRTAHPSVLFNRSAALSVGGYLIQDFPAEDLSLWLRMSRLGKLVSSPEVLLHYRVGRGSISGTKRDAMRVKKQEHLSNIRVNPRDVALFQDNYFELFESYKNHSDQTSRRILLFRDYKKLFEHSEINQRNTLIEKHFMRWMMKTPGASFQVGKMAKEVIIRQIYRSINFPKH
jgi:glycosyltransferase involved in cell wall biosynthesis